MDATDDVTQDSLDLLARWPLARAQQRQHGPAGRRLENLDRLEAIAAGMCVEQCKLLLSVHCIVGVIDVEHDAARHALKTGTEQIDQFKPHARKLPPARGVLQARERRLPHQLGARHRQPSACHLQGRIAAQQIKVIAVLMATGNREHPRPRHVAVAVPDTPAIAIVRNVPAEHRGERWHCSLPPGTKVPLHTACSCGVQALGLNPLTESRPPFFSSYWGGPA